MSKEFTYPTPAEIRAYELQAKKLRAEFIKDSAVALYNMPKRALTALRNLLARPAHA